LIGFPLSSIYKATMERLGGEDIVDFDTSSRSLLASKDRHSQLA
jgi:hypothetical protein